MSRIIYFSLQQLRQIPPGMAAISPASTIDRAGSFQQKQQSPMVNRRVLPKLEE
jgi:hypothetical protein